MTDSSNVWEAGEAASTPAPDAVAGIGPDSDALPPVVDLFMATVEDFKVHWKGHLLTGLGAIVVGFPVVMLIVMVCIAPMIAGIILENSVLMLVGFATYFFGILGGSALVMGPITFGMFAAENQHLDGDEEALGFTGALRHVFDRFGAAVGYQLVAMGLAFVGLLFFIIGAWVVQIALSMALPALAVHRLGLGAAISRSFSHVRAHPKWHLGFWGLGFAVLMIAGNIPIIGYAIGWPFWAAYTLRGYRVVYGNGATDAA